MNDEIVSILSVKFSEDNAQKAVTRFKEAEARYYQNDYESCLLKFGKFVEIIKNAVLETVKNDVNWSNWVDFSEFCEKMENLPVKKYEESIRKYIPRELRDIYDLRSGRGVAHEGKIDPNFLDATVSYRMSTWVLAELIRLFGLKTPDDAKMLVDRLYERKFPFVEKIDENDFRILLPGLTKREEILLLLYYQGENWTNNNDLIKWINPSNSKLITNELPKMYNERFIIYRDRKSKITKRGNAFVERVLWPKFQSKLTF